MQVTWSRSKQTMKDTELEFITSLCPQPCGINYILNISILTTYTHSYINTYRRRPTMLPSLYNHNDTPNGSLNITEFPTMHRRRNRSHIRFLSSTRYWKRDNAMSSHTGSSHDEITQSQSIYYTMKDHNTRPMDLVWRRQKIII